MNLGFFETHKSWLVAAGIALVIALWLLSGQFGGTETAAVESTDATAPVATARSSVRVRTQSAEQIERTIVVNGKTAADDHQCPCAGFLNLGQNVSRQNDCLVLTQLRDE